ncbi:hypothetical protein L6164_002457 [Bauhinia variegata]|uniref:Uncharacterized protein n=1 Tax=Bauhinia variegata TaxID=167791 RepID=A0ACB9PY97_BAUVA|nr:hypothetical protein L6164_002457 [Bauhinia variegata]
MEKPSPSSFIFLFFLLLLKLNHGFSETGVPVGHQLLVQVPVAYQMGFTGRGFLIETNQTTPNFRVALSVEAIDGKYSCSLQVFLGDVKVWDSGHYSRFYTTVKCVLKLTVDGDLRLEGQKGRVGWKTGTSGQGVERLEILNTGNLVLMDGLNTIKWQSFNFPTDVMLWGQRLDVATRLTTFQSNSTLFYSFEIQYNRIALYLNFGAMRYSYWELKPSKNRNITFAKLGSRGLELFDAKDKKIAQIPWQGFHPLRFLALKNETGNFGLYYYSPEKAKFEASFQALNSTCDLPVACQPYGVCTFSKACSCIQILAKVNEGSSDCSGEIPGGFCNGKEAEMLELDNVSSVLRNTPTKVNISREACQKLCLQDCKCAAVLYSGSTARTNLTECYMYRLVLGLKQVEKGNGLSYMVKVPKGTLNHGQHNMKKWVFVLVGVVDGIVLLLVAGGFGYWFIRKRRRSATQSQASTS